MYEPLASGEGRRAQPSTLRLSDEKLKFKGGVNTRNEGTAAKSKTSYQNVPHAQLQNCTADTLSISPLTSASLLRGGGPWEAGWDLGGRLAAGEPNCPSSSSSKARFKARLGWA